jgi:hypothetical protein
MNRFPMEEKIGLYQKSRTERTHREHTVKSNSSKNGAMSLLHEEFDRNWRGGERLASWSELTDKFEKQK